MNIIVLDTETIGLTKNFIYDLGYIVYDTDNQAIIKSKSYIISQVWNNKPLMETAYYYNKKFIYNERLASGYSKKVGWGNACRYLLNDIKKYQVQKVFAYNSPFDSRAFAFTCNFFKKSNPLEMVQVCDIWKDYAKITICENQAYKDYCVLNGFMTKHKTPRPQEKAETVFSYLTNNTNYAEEHTGLEDSKIELEILLKALELGVSL